MMVATPALVICRQQTIWHDSNCRHPLTRWPRPTSVTSGQWESAISLILGQPSPISASAMSPMIYKLKQDYKSSEEGWKKHAHVPKYIWGDLSSITRVEVNRFFSKLDKFLTPRLAEDIADPFHEIVWSNTRFSCTVCRRNHFLKILYLHSCYVVSRMLWL